MKKAKLFMMLALLVMGVSNVFAQNVTIKATNGSMIAATPQGNSDYDVFFKAGGFATWQHEQLSMVLTVSDMTGLTATDQLANPANNLFSDGTHIQIAKGLGTYNICYLSLSLPKGYRFTGYNIKFSKPGETTKRLGNNSMTFNSSNESSEFGETGKNFGTYTVSKSAARGGAAQTISRTSMTDTDMGNVLYFKLQNPSNGRALITLDEAEFFFTAEADYTPLTTPGTVHRVSAIDIPFSTSKVDYGTIQNRTYDGAQRVSYSSANVKDIMANFTLYEAEAIKDGEDFDGVDGKVVDYKEGSISVENGYYRIGAEDAANPGTEEHIYYLETPTYVLLQDNVTKNPVGYRIIGAQIDYKYGPTYEYGTIQKQYTTFYISNSNYYLNSTGGATTSQNQRALWFIDEEGYIRTGVNGQTYLTNTNSQSGGASYAGTTINKEEAVKFSIDNNGYIYYTEGGTNYWLRRTSSWGSNYFRFQNNTGNRATRKNSGTTTVNIVDDIIDTEAAHPYTLKVYDKTGTTAQTINVSSTNASGSVVVAGMNNDALKIGVIGTGLIQGTLTLQALDPYLDQMEVVCTDKDVPAIRLTQNFTASDFSVSGGEFHFYVPVDTRNVAITFENLKSKYFDESYTGGSNTHTSRINFVKSAHYNAFGTSNNKIYSNTSEASNAQLERLKVGIVGTEKFKFNNADELANANGVLTEYPFSLENYAATPNNGTFDVMEYAVTDEDQVSTRYVFTTDETRYNIAPTTAIQHRAYAYYQMIVHVQSATYEPKIKFTKVYDKTFYTDDEGAIKYDAFYGVEVTAPYTENGVVKQGYASTKDIFEGIERILGTDKVDDFGNTDLPASSKQIIYLDFSKLAGIYQITSDENPDMESYSNSNAKNCLIFLPKGSSAPNDNVAYQLGSGGFQAANNIIITDKQPFYSPYKIQVDAAYVAEYKRQITSDQNGKVINATVVLPFTIAVNEGVHTNDDNSCTFTVSTMNTGTTNVLAHEEGSSFDFGIAYFKPISGTVTESNKPYVLTIEPSSWTDANSSFLVRSHGAVIEPTPAGGVFTNESASGTFEGDTYNFTHKGTYVGKEIESAATASEKVFYFAHDYFLDSKTLKKGLSLKILPFRSFYQYSGGALAKMTQFRIVFGENEDLSGTNGINEIQRDADLAVIPGKGVITLMARAEKDITIHAANGQTVDKCNLKAGETRTVAVPAGVYVINGVKMVVK